MRYELCRHTRHMHARQGSPTAVSCHVEYLIREVAGDLRFNGRHKGWFSPALGAPTTDGQRVTGSL